VAAVTLSTGSKHSTATTPGRTCAAAPVPTTATAGGRYSRTTCLKANAHVEGVGSTSGALPHSCGIRGLATTSAVGLLDNGCFLRCCRRRQSVGGVALLSSRANRGGSSTTSTTAGRSSSSAPSSADGVVSRSYHLIWSPSFGRNLLLSTTILFFMRYILTDWLGLGGALLPSLATMGGCHNGHNDPGTAAAVRFSSLSRSIRLVLLPLLSSSCCALQLLINAIAGVGCAGFNTILGPVRPIFLSVLMYATAMSFPGPKMNGLGKWCSNTAITFFLALMPELLHIWNNNSWRRLASQVTTATTANDAKVGATVELDIPSMGCAACINKIDSTITGSNGVLSGRSWLNDDPKGGRARFDIAANSIDDVNEIIKSVVEKVDGSGFPCRVETVDVVDKRPV